MGQTRRTWVKGSGAALLGCGLAGCSGIFEGDDPDTDATSTADEPGSSSDEDDESRIGPRDLAVAAEWNAIRARLWDALALGYSDSSNDGAAVAQRVFARFENARGEYNAHEALEATSEPHYGAFEEALGELRTEGLEEGDVDRAHEEVTIADTQLAEAQQMLTDREAAQALDLQALGMSLSDAAFLATAGAFDAAAVVAGETAARFEDASVHDAIENADDDIYEQFEDGIERVATAARNDDLEGVRAGTDDAFGAAIDGGYALAPSDAIAGTGHLAAYQARGWDAATLASLGGPSTAFAHAAALTVYRARAHDAVWLYGRGHGDAAAQVVRNVFAHFEGARAHEALEDASQDAYQQFEDEGLSSLSTAIENDDPERVESAIEAINEGLVTGIEALGTGSEPALLEAGYFRARIEDALERYRLGDQQVATEIARGLFETFETNEADFHESLEETDEFLYATFEGEHLNGLITAFEKGDDEAVDEHANGIHETLLAFETTAGSTAQVNAVESGYMAARVFDASVLDVLSESERARSVLQATFQRFESGAGGFHEALEGVDHDLYESFEEALEEAIGATRERGAVADPARTFNQRAIEASYTIVASARGSFGSAATSIVQELFADFEESHVHELLEETDRDAYEEFEAALNDYAGALEEESAIDAAAERFARAALRAQFAVAGAPDGAPAVDAEPGVDETDPELEGGPNVVEGVPEDVDHVVEMHAVTFEPDALTVQQGDTVAWEFAAGEPHSVTAYEDVLPDGAEFWASGGFESEETAREGWENGQGAVRSGQSYVYTFETPGEHGYFCIPHEAAGMVGTVVVE